MIGVDSHGDFSKTMSFFNRILNRSHFVGLDRYGQMGVEALSKATPVDSGLSGGSWSYKLISGPNPGIEWYNSHTTSSGMPVVILIQYGHGTGTGGYIQGRDFINPALRPVFDRIADDVWKEVSK
jgi:hypothetical protein